MGDTTIDLRDRYEQIFRDEWSGMTDRITTTLDDYTHALTDQASSKSVYVGGPRVTIRMAELRSLDARLARQLRYHPAPHLRAMELAAQRVASDLRPGYDKDSPHPHHSHNCVLHVAIAGPISAAALSPRQLNSSVLRQLVCVEGVATKVSMIKPKVVQSTHYCPATLQHMTREYVDATDLRLGLCAIDNEGKELPDRRIQITNTVYPQKDDQGNPLETEYGLSVFKDHQTITLQEMPERAPMGQLPRSVELVLDHDLVDSVKPGDRVAVVGVYRALAGASRGQQSTSGVFRTVILVNHVRIIGCSGESTLHFSSRDVKSIRSLSSRPDILKTLGKSICPSVHGHQVIKQAIALQLLSGVEKNLANGTHLRGDINILLVGDPSTAKSQLLRAAMTIAPLAVSTTGKGSSGVGLTAAVTSDPETRERRLEAGAMVLGDRGLVCVDEFDKMSENDRVSIHEAMEQQTVTIAKAGIHAQLNARCSVLAAANPVYGQYDRRKGIHDNIGLPDSLLSRFDLLFVVLDQMDCESDRRIANHVIRGHQYRRHPGQAGYDSNDEDDAHSDDDDNDDINAEMKAQRSVWQRNTDGVLCHDFLRKYIHFCKSRAQPVLTNEARTVIVHRYAELRARQDARTLPITARSLETVIRLSTAHAKARLSASIHVLDVQIAMDLLSFALYHDTQQQNNNKPQQQLPSTAISTTNTDINNNNTTQSRQRPNEVSTGNNNNSRDEDLQSPPNKRTRWSEEANNNHDNNVRQVLKILSQSDGESMALDQLVELLGDQTRDEIEASVHDLEQQNLVMIENGEVYPIKL